MAIDRILLHLRTAPVDRHGALELGRLSFLAWLMSLPDDRDVAGQARLANARAAPLTSVTPSIAVLSNLLEQAAHGMPIPVASHHRRADGKRDRQRQHALH